MYIYVYICVYEYVYIQTYTVKSVITKPVMCHTCVMNYSEKG